MRTYEQFNVFMEVDFDSYSRSRLESLKQTIHGEREDYLVNVNENEYVEHLLSLYCVEPLKLDFDNIEGSSREEMIPAERFPHNFAVFEGESYPKQVITYHVPVSGDLNLLRCIPNPRVLNTYKVSLEGDAICFDIVDLYGGASRVKSEADGVINLLKTQSSHLAANVAKFNSSIRKEAENLFKSRKQELLKRSETFAQLGVRMRKATDVPTTFAVPAVRKQVATKPKPGGAVAKPPDPTLDEGVYQEILTTIYETGKVFERLPSTYAAKDEESLRDHLILQLEPRFEYSTTGETFNKAGKTDILIRHEKSNIFVAECKFWGGAKKHFETIDQIFSYLTWRDSKTAIVYFVDTKEMSVPLKAIQESTPQHACFVTLNGKKSESWFDYSFHLPGDQGITIRLSILCFHLPKGKSS
jgi:hypothetical protein